MKKFKLPVIIIIIIMTLGFTNSHAQTSGLYLTCNDFLNHKLSYSSINPQSNKIALHGFFEGRKVTVTDNGKKMDFAKNELFGYRGHDGHDYRFYNNKAYQVVDTAGFYIYRYEKLEQQGKGLKPTDTYYFSTNTNTVILPLTVENIAFAFAQNHKFKYMVDAEFKPGIKLYTFDNEYARREIKEIYYDSLK